MKGVVTALAVVAGLAAAPALAQGWYAGFGAGVGNLEKSGEDITGVGPLDMDDSDTTYTVRVGYRLNPYLAIEAGYYDLGKYVFGGTVRGVEVAGTSKAKSYGLSAVGIAPLGDSFELYARIGVEESELKTNSTAGILTADVSDRETGATYGIGGRYLFSKNLGMFAEWMKNDKIEVDSYLVGIDFRF